MDATSEQVAGACPVDLTVSISLAAADLGDTMVDYLSGQPLLPRWRLVVVEAKSVLAPDVAVIPGAELRLHRGRVRGGEFVFIEPHTAPTMINAFAQEGG